MANSKLLDFNEGKSGMILLGKKKWKRKIREELEENPIMFCGKPMNNFDYDHYLGDFISSSLQESVFSTIQRRKGLVTKLINEIRVTIQDCRSETLGGLMVGLDIWRKAVTPYLYNNSSTWLEMPKKAFSLLDSITHSFFRSLFLPQRGIHW